MLQCVLYLGRDGDYDPRDSPEERYDQVRRNLDAVVWGSEKDDARQLAGKAPLCEYLQDGLRALRIVMQTSSVSADNADADDSGLREVFRRASYGYWRASHDCSVTCERPSCRRAFLLLCTQT